MKNKLRLLLILAFIASVNLFSESIDEIVAKMESKNGIDKYQKFKTVRLEAKQEVMGMSGAMNFFVKKPNKIRIDMDMQGKTIIQAFDGEKGWSVNPFMGTDTNELDKETSSQLQSQINIFGDRLINYKQLGITLSLVGVESVDGTDCYKIKAVEKDQKEFTYFVDRSSYKTLQMKAKMQGPNGEMELTTNLKEYKDFSGVQIPTLMEIDAQMMTMKITFTKIEFDKNIDDSVFKR
ncbi:MAG: outer membrane lipoprotein-sorting protein [Candidatus Kapabacteria bacterium]|nr:outer membrane lipoprotein-sorting protein [Candidatus Kapabacteria bacterium]